MNSVKKTNKCVYILVLEVTCKRELTPITPKFASIIKLFFISYKTDLVEQNIMVIQL